jgi:pyridoxine/pyridoxamine 5'-phosphate oxidase
MPGSEDRAAFAVDRPQMKVGYGIATDSAGMLPWSWAEERLVASRSYWVCSTRADGRPHAMPVWGLWIDGAVFYSTDPESVKARNLAARPQVVIHLESGDDVVIVSGVCERVSGAELPASFVDAYEAKYGHRVDVTDPAFGFYRVRPDDVLAWREVDFPTSATRFRPLS